MRLLSLVLCTVVMVPGSVKAGFIIHEQDYASDEPENKTISVAYIQNNRMKFQEKDDFIYYIWDLEKGNTYQVNESAGIYSGGTFESQLESIRNYIARFKREMADEIRVFGGEMTGYPHARTEAEGFKLDILETADMEIIAGYRSVKHEIRIGGKKIEDIWISRDMDITGELDYRRYKKMFQKWMKAISDAVIEPGSVHGEEDWTESEDYIGLFEKGYTMRQVEYDEWGEYITEVIKVEAKNIPDEEFNIPRGFRKVTPEEFMEIGGE